MNDRILDWELLKGRATDVLEAIKAEWESLLSDKQFSEEVYHEFLSEHAGFFFCDAAHRPFAISKLRLGSDFTTDFVVPYDFRSVGWLYDFIEIESPHAKPFTLGGKPSARLVDALNQTIRWKLWMDQHSEEMRQLLGSDALTRDSIRFTVYIGNRENVLGSLAMSNQWAKRNGLFIRSFDSLTDAIMGRHFQNRCDAFSNENGTAFTMTSSVV